MLATGKIGLKSDLRKAYKKAEKTGSDLEDPIPEQAADVGNAIHEYMIKAKVKTVVQVVPGQLYQAAAATAVPVASTTAPGTGKGEGEISFDQSDVDTLISDIEAAYIAAAELGQAGGDVFEQLSTDMSEAIYKFAITATVDTSVDVDPGQVLAQYMAMVGTAPAPLPATTLKGTGSGTGTIS